jgi:hypothetical protein
MNVFLKINYRIEILTVLLKLSTKIQETLEFMKQKNRYAFLAFTTQTTNVCVVNAFPGLIQYLWCDLFECSSNLVPQISNVSWMLSVHTVLDVTPNRKVRRA